MLFLGRHKETLFGMCGRNKNGALRNAKKRGN
jgi:hypothetical protein